MKLKPLADRVLIQPTAAEEVTASGIIIPKFFSQFITLGWELKI